MVLKRFVPETKLENVKVTLMVDTPHENYEMYDDKTDGIEKHNCVFVNASNDDGSTDFNNCKLLQNKGTKDKPKWKEIKGKWKPFPLTPASLLGPYKILDKMRQQLSDC